jgi:hypothetical protein
MAIMGRWEAMTGSCGQEVEDQGRLGVRGCRCRFHTKGIRASRFVSGHCVYRSRVCGFTRAIGGSAVGGGQDQAGGKPGQRGVGCERVEGRAEVLQ